MQRDQTISTPQSGVKSNKKRALEINEKECSRERLRKKTRLAGWLVKHKQSYTIADLLNKQTFEH